MLTVQADRYDALVDFIEKARQQAGNLLFRAWIDEVERRILPLIQQAKWLSAKYDVVVTNPPYMGASNMSTKLSAFVKKHYPDTKSDLSTVCMEKTLDMCKDNGYMTMINIPVWMFLSSYEQLRSSILRSNTYSSMLHLGRGIFGSDFGTTAFVIAKKHIENYRGNYRRLFEKQGAVDRIEEKEQKFFAGKGAFVATQENFERIPRKAIAYWASDACINAYRKYNRLDSFASVKKGMSTADDNRFLRLWYEINSSKSQMFSSFEKAKWFMINKGGSFRRWYGNNEYVVNWENNGLEMKAFRNAVIRNEQFYFKDFGVTWTYVTNYKLNVRYTEKSTFAAVGPCIFADRNRLLWILGMLNTCVAQMFADSVGGQTITYEVGEVASIPTAYESDSDNITDIVEIVENNIAISKADWDAFETSWDFQSHPLAPTAYERREQLSYGIHSAERKKSVTLLANRYTYWEWDCNYRFSTLKKNEEELNRIFIDIYGLADELTPEVEDKDVTVRRADLPRDIRSLISYAVGCMFGRYSLDTPGLVYAGGAWDGSKYTTFLPDEDAIIPICDDEYFDDDIVGRFVEFIATVFGKETLEENLQFIADALGGRGSSREVIRSYFLTGFYADHVKTYQKRPIYWLFDSGKKNGFKCLVYMHRYCPDTIARIRTDYVHEQQSRYRTAIESLEQARDNATTAGNKVKVGKKLAAVEAQAKELREYEEKIHHLADQMIAIDLDDGVKHNYAIFQDVLAKIK